MYSKNFHTASDIFELTNALNASQTVARRPAHRPLARAVHFLNRSSVIRSAVVRVRISRRASRVRAGAAQIAIDRIVVVLVLARRRQHHRLCGLLGPAHDEVAVAGVRVAASQLDGRRAAPAVWQHVAQVVADAETQLGHALVAVGARAAAGALVRRLKRVGVDALREVEQSLQVRAARRRGEAVLVGFNAVVAFAEPLDLGVSRHLVGSSGRRVTGDHLEILWDGHLGLGLAQVVVGREAEDGDVVVGVATVGGVDEGGHPFFANKSALCVPSKYKYWGSTLTVNRQIVGVVRGAAALLQLRACRGASRHSVGAEEGVHVRDAVLAGELDRVDVLVHHHTKYVGLGVGMGGPGGHCASKGVAKSERRHPVRLRKRMEGFDRVKKAKEKRMNKDTEWSTRGCEREW